MKISASKHITKYGKEILIRQAKISDASGLIECTKSCLKSNFIPLANDEFHPTLEEHQNWIKKFLEDDCSLLLIAEYNNSIIGNIDVTINPRKMLSHTGYLGMGVHEDWQNQGIGTLLLNKVINWCDHMGTEFLWLQVFGNNDKAIKLYKRKGFFENGRQVKFIKDRNGNYFDNVIMTRKTPIVNY